MGGTTMKTTLLFVALGLVLAGCVKEVGPPEGPLSIEVTFDESAGQDLGSEEEPLAIYEDGASGYEMVARTFTLDVAVLDVDGTLMTSFDGPLGLKCRPGTVIEPWTLDVVGGVASGVEVRIKDAHGPARIWVEDTVREGASYATGVSPVIRYAYPTLADVQRPDCQDLSGLLGNHVEIDVEDRDLIVTHVASDGFYVTDTTDPPGSYNSMYAFTFSRPRDLVEGDKLAALDGNVVEYIAFTELGYPSFLIESSGHVLPEPTLIDDSHICGDTDTMEQYESSLVKIEGAWSDFEGADDCTDYLEYGQWPILLDISGGECDPVRLTVVSSYTVPGLRFTECEEGRTPEPVYFQWMQGTLRHIKYADPPWILEPRGCEDIPMDSWPEDCLEDSVAAKGHYSGPPPAPRQYRRDIPWCEGVPYYLD